MTIFLITKRISFLSVLVLVGASIFGMRCFAVAPNILFIVSDDHGWGDLPSNWGKTEVQLPALDALANQGVGIGQPDAMHWLIFRVCCK